MRYPTSLKSKLYPEFIRTSSYVQDFSFDERNHFKSIGLENTKNSIKSISINDLNDYKDRLKNHILSEFAVSVRAGHNYAINGQRISIDTVVFPDAIKSLTDITIKYCQLVYSQVGSSWINGNRWEAKACNLPEFETIIGKKLINLNKYKDKKVVFSGNGAKSGWDIATMSMRGISSCQRWSSSSHRSKLIGSILDPRCGIIYITNSNPFKEKGEKMICRAIVRHVQSDNPKIPQAILLERTYPSSYTNIEAFAVFVKFLKEKTNNSIPIIDTPSATYIPGLNAYDHYASYAYVPASKRIQNLSDDYKSYRDSGVSYR